jgi:2'-5' RNA ligase
MPNLIDLLLTSEKAWRKGGGGGASSGVGGGGGKGPGSRGGKFFINAGGHVEYGAKPSGARGGGSGSTAKPQVLRTHGPSAHLRAAVARNKPQPKAQPQRAVSTGHGGGSGKPRVGELRAGYRIKPQTSAGKLASHRRMLSEMDKAIKLGKDPHGNKLSAASLDKLRFLATGLRTELKVSGTSVGQKEMLPVQAQPGHTGVMVAFYIDTFSPDAAVKLQIPGGETWDALHLTLAYLGDSTSMGSDAESKLYQLISQFAAGQQPLEGTVSGIGLFNNTEEGETNAFYASFDSPGLPRFRQGLIDLLQSNGLMPVQNHGFTPHITLAYVPKGLPIPNVELPQVPIIFTKVTVKWGDKRTDFSIGFVTKEVKEQIAEKASARQPFTVFKDAKGEWRWIGVSSSAARDADGETVSLKALEADTATKDITRDYGPLNWWHTPIKLGTCDFNAMDGPLLVESGTFVSESVAGWVSKAIADGVFKPGMSLEFEHCEPGPPVLPGRVFTRINKVGRALLPAEKASNLLTSFKVYNMSSALAGTGKEVNAKVKEKQMIPEDKLKLLEQFMPKELLDGLLEGNQTAIKMAEAANYSFKSMSPEPTPAAVAVETPVAVAEVAPVPVPAPVEVAAVPEPVAVVEQPQEEPAEGEVAFDTEAIFSDLINRIKTEILAVLPAQQPVAAKEITDALDVNTLAVKEVTTALNTVIAENKSLKARLDALEGNQPAAVRARVTQGQGIPASDLPEATRQLVNPASKETDPYLAIASQLGLIPAPRG